MSLYPKNKCANYKLSVYGVVGIWAVAQAFRQTPSLSDSNCTTGQHLPLFHCHVVSCKILRKGNIGMADKPNREKSVTKERQCLHKALRMFTQTLWFQRDLDVYLQKYKMSAQGPSKGRVVPFLHLKVRKAALSSLLKLFCIHILLIIKCFILRVLYTSG